MELRHIRYFLAISEEKSFTQAAKRLGISQPPLSMQIKNLEDEVGTELFYRSTNGVELTPAGQAFLKLIQPIQQRVEDAMKIAQGVANGEEGLLRLGFTGTSMLNPILPKTIRLFQQKYPKVQLKLEESNSLDLVEHILNNEVDIALLRPASNIPQSIHIQNLIYEPLIAIVPLEANIKDEQYISLKQLQDQNFIISPYSVAAGLYEAIMNACAHEGFEPKIGQHAPRIVSIISLVAANLGVSLVPESSRQLAIKGVKYLKIKEQANAMIGLALAYRYDIHSQPAINFASIIQQLIHSYESFDEPH